MRCLECQERILGSRWAKDNGVNLLNDFTSIFLGAVATPGEEGNIVVKYSLENEFDDHGFMCEQQASFNPKASPLLAGNY